VPHSCAQTAAATAAAAPAVDRQSPMSSATTTIARLKQLSLAAALVPAAKSAQPAPAAAAAHGVGYLC
jgi:hypothetical protein